MHAAPARSAPDAEAPKTGAPLDARRVMRWVAGLAVSAALTLGFAQMASYEARPVTLDGVALPSTGDPEPFVRELARAWSETELSLDAGTAVLRMSRRDLGGQIDVERAVAEARLARGDATIWDRLHAFAVGRPRALRFRRRVDVEQTRVVVEEIRERASVEPVAVRHDGSGGRDGASISTVAGTSAISDAIYTDALLVRLPARRLAAPAPTQRDRRSARFDVVVSAHETRYHGGGDLAGRARNIYLAARYLDGSVIDPRGELSFNEVVGERSFERGFAAAIELTRGGRRTEGIGGGVCQVAATLHAAAFFGGFDIIEHHPHTRNSSYIPAGLDSAVSWPSKDVRIRNPHPFHVRVRATAEHDRLRIELMGQQRAPRVEWNTHVVRRIQRGDERVVDGNLPLGALEVDDDGEDGSVLERTRTVYWPDGAVTERVSLRYPVVNRLVRVGPDGRRPAPGADG